MTYQSLVKKALDLGALDARLIDTKMIVFYYRSYLKCRFGCNRWGRYWTCSPHLSISPELFMEAFAQYSIAHDHSNIRSSERTGCYPCH